MRFWSCLLCALVTCLYLSCNDDDSAPRWRTSQEMFSCFKASDWTDQSIAVELLNGQWAWVTEECPNNNDNINTKAYDGLSLKFLADNQLEVYQNGQLITSHSWQIEKNTSNFKIKCQPQYSLIQGTFLLCDNQFTSAYSQVDGCDNAFLRE